MTSSQYCLVVRYVLLLQGSILNIFGNNTLLVPEFLTTLLFLSGLKEYKIDSHVDNFSNIFEGYEALLGLPERAHEIFNTPGWLSRFIGQFSEFLADGSSGVIPSLRSMVLKSFGQYDKWEEIYMRKYPEAIEFEWDSVLSIQAQQRAADAAAKEAIRLAAVIAAAEETAAAARLAMAEVAADGGIDMSIFQPDPADVVDPVKSDVMVVNHEEQYVETEEECAANKKIRAELIEKCAQECLPPVQREHADLQAKLTQLKENLIFLSGIQADSHIQIPLDVSMRAAKKREQLLAEIEEIVQLMESQQASMRAHICATYDAVRMFTVGVSSFGMGTRSLCVRGATKGCNWIPEVLPSALGERSGSRQEAVDKAERASKRRVAALAALEREKLRRNMTDEEKEKLRLEKLAVQRREWAAEEAQQLAGCSFFFRSSR